MWLFVRLVGYLYISYNICGCYYIWCNDLLHLRFSNIYGCYYIWCYNRRLLTSLTVHAGEAVRALTGVALQILDTGGAILAWFTLTVVAI